MFRSSTGWWPADFSAPTVITSMFLHGGWMHVIGNMWYRWILRQRRGSLGTGAFWSLLAVRAGGGPGQVAIDPQSTLPVIGASGAHCGVMGAYFVLYPHSRVLTLIPLIIWLEIMSCRRSCCLLLVLACSCSAPAPSRVTARAAAAAVVAFMAHVAASSSDDRRAVFRKRQPDSRWA